MLHASKDKVIAKSAALKGKNRDNLCSSGNGRHLAIKRKNNL